MVPGENCLTCHSPGGGATAYAVAGTVYPRADSSDFDGIANITVTVTGADGKTVSMLSNSAGNFFAEGAVEFPIDVFSAIGNDGRVSMEPNSLTGACGSCHEALPDKGADGRILIAP